MQLWISVSGTRLRCKPLCSKELHGGGVGFDVFQLFSNGAYLAAGTGH